jgi:hypothetical protein
MSKIDESDNQRIREMQETELRNRVDQAKKDNDARVTRSFAEVMKQKGQTEEGQKLARSKQTKDADQKKASEQSVLGGLVKRSPKEAAELSKRAALSHAMQSNLSKVRAKQADEAGRAESSRTEDIAARSEEDKDRIDKEVHEDADADAIRTEERDVEQKRERAEAEGRPDQGRTDERGGRRDQDRGGGQEERRPESVQAAQAPKRASEVHQLTQELIDKIVSAIHTAHVADGRTEMHIDLKGTLLDGVRLKVSAENGKVKCSFEGCDKSLKNLIESSKGALMRGLSKRGLSLVSLSAS